MENDTYLCRKCHTIYVKQKEKWKACCDAIAAILLLFLAVFLLLFSKSDLVLVIVGFFMIAVSFVLLRRSAKEWSGLVICPSCRSDDGIPSQSPAARQIVEDGRR
jgi:uncharacterized membrane protein YfcA